MTPQDDPFDHQDSSENATEPQQTMQVTRPEVPISTGDMVTLETAAANGFDPQRVAYKREERLFLILSIFIGVLSGLMVVSFRIAIDWIKIITLGSAPHKGEPRLFIVPAVAGLLVAAMVRWIFPGARGSGVNQTKAALYIYNGYISFKTVIGKFITSAIAIGCGHSLGPEDPSLQIGAGVASIIARKLQLSQQSLRLFAPIGAAAGLAAAFNAPISAILFVIEEVIGYWSAAVLGSVVLAAISSVSVARIFWGSQPMFTIPSVTLRDPRELTAYAVLGVIGGIAAFVFSRALGYLRPRLRNMSANKQMFQPALAGLLVGLIGYYGVPEIMGPGYDVMNQALHGQFTWQFLGAMVAFKMIATTLSFSSGTPGGMFAPALFVGTMLGAGVGTVEHMILPHASGAVGSYALVGMGVLFAGFMRAPLTSVFMVLEMSGNYSIILPVILANTIAYLIARSLQPVPIFELFTHQDGLDLPSMEEQREAVSLHVEDALVPMRVPLLKGSDLLGAAAGMLGPKGAPRRPGVPRAVVVQMADGSCYVLAEDELSKLLGKQGEEQTLARALAGERTPVLFPDLPLDTTLRHFKRWPLLPISNRASKGKLEGMVTLPDVLARYERN
jgi:CIC family chloride channel protein